MSLFGIGAAAVANIGAGLIGSAMSANSAKSTAKLSGQLERQNWEYQQKNAHQFEVEDLKAAGLNPIISATNGQIASMPNVSASDNGVGANVTNALTSLGRNLLDKELKSKDLEIENQRLENDRLRIGNDTKRLENETRRNYSEIDLLNANTSKVAAERQEVMARVDNLVKKLPYEIDALVANADQARATAGYMSEQVRYLGYQEGLTQLQIKKLESELNDPKNVLNKQFWKKVLESDEPEYRALRGSFERGLQNDIYFSFGSGQGSDVSLDKLLGMLKNGKYLLK